MKDVNLKKYNSYKLDCMARELYIPKDLEELREILKYVKKRNLKYKIIGNGTNLIFKNNYYDGVIIKLDNFNKVEVNDNIITVGSGYSVIKLALWAANNSLGGLEFASGIPGSIGGCIFNNAGAYGISIGEIVKELTIITPDLEIKKLTNYDYGYRTSFFKENPGYIILEAKLKVLPKNKEAIMEFIQNKREIRKQGQPLEFPSAGSVFRNPEGNYAGKLIEDAGLKGKQIGGAQISEKHANFIINAGEATGEDIVNLINEIKKTIKEENGIDLVLEQEIVE